MASRRGFHGAACLSFRASVPASNAGYAAAADFSDEDQTRGQGGSSGGASDVGLEISKLGISEHIVSALAGKGITKLFPIQVSIPFHFVLISVVRIYHFPQLDVCLRILLRNHIRIHDQNQKIFILNFCDMRR